MQCKAYSPYYIAVMERPSRHTVARHPGHDPVRVLVRRRSPPPVIAVSIASWPCTQCKSNAQLDTVGHHRNQCKSYAPYCRSHQTFVATHCQARRCRSSSCPFPHHSPVASRVHCSCRRPPVVLHKKCRSMAQMSYMKRGGARNRASYFPSHPIPVVRRCV